MASSYEKRVAAARKAGFSSPYEQRIARAREKAAREGRPFSRAEARGHKSNEEENARRRVKRLERNTKTGPYTDKQGQHRDPVGEARLHGFTWADIERELREKQDVMKSPHHIAEGKARWLNRDQMLDPAFYWYHRS